ncbi:MAG: GNAT family N-acetyltransferase [Pyrinomonadaceae bacterium]
MHRISIQAVTDPTALADLKLQWQELYTASGGSPFLSWEWQTAWHRSFGADKSPLVLKTYDADRLIGIFPLLTTQKNVLGTNLKRIGFIGEDVGGADYLDVIARPEHVSEVLRSNIEFLYHQNDFDILCLDSLSSDSETSAALGNVKELLEDPRLHFAQTRGQVCPMIDLDAGWPAVLSQSRRSSNFKRKLKRLQKMSGFEFRSITAASELPAAFEIFLELHEKRWSREGGSELSGHPDLISFHRDVVKSMADTGLLRFDQLWVEGGCRSSSYAFDNGHTLFYYNAGYDPDWAPFSVGMVLTGLSIQSAVERGNRVYDFLRGEEAYKFDWANASRQLVRATLRRNTLPALMSSGIGYLDRTGRKLSGSILPTQTAETLRSWRRRRKRSRRSLPAPESTLSQAYE